MTRCALVLLVAASACRNVEYARPTPEQELAHRVAALEQGLRNAWRAEAAAAGSGSGSTDLATLAERVDELELLAREEHVLQKDIQALLSRLSERAANSPAPLAATLRNDGLDSARRYRIAVAGSPAFGDAAAAVTLVVATQVPERYTHELFPILRAVRAKYGADLRVVMEGFVAIPPALATTVAACAAAHQGPDALDKLEDALATLRELAQADASKPWPDADDARSAAGGANLDLKVYDADLAGCAKAVDREQRALALAGQTAAPTLWINGRPFVGAKSADQLTAIVDDELAKAKADRDKGGNPKTYYDRLMKTAQTAQSR